MGWRDAPIVKPAGSWRDAPLVNPAPEQSAAPDPTPRNPDQMTHFAPEEPEATRLERAVTDQFSPRGLQIGAQGVARGAANLAGAPGDLANMTFGSLDAMLAAAMQAIDPEAFAEANRIVQEDMPSLAAAQEAQGQRSTFFPGSEEIQTAAGAGLRDLGVPVIAEEDMSPGERITERATAFGTEAMLPSAGAIRAAEGAVRAPGVTRDAVPFVQREIARAVDEGTAGRAFAGDTAAGVGAGAAQGSFEESSIDDALGDVLGPAGVGVGNLAAILSGGLAGNLAARRAGSMLPSGQPGPRRDAVDPKTGEPFHKAILDAAAYVAQQSATNPGSAARAIRENADELRLGEGFRTQSDMPTAGQMADRDFGLGRLEKTLRSADAAPFASRDASLMSQIREFLETTAPPGDGRSFTDEFAGRAEARRGEASQRVQAAEQAETDFAGRRRQAGEELAAQGGGREQAAETLDEIVTSTLRGAQDRKNRAAEAIDPEGTVKRDAGFLQETADEVEASRGALNDPSATVPGGILSRIRSLAETDPETGETIGPGSVTVKDLNALRPEISDAIAQARANQEFTKADNLAKLRDAINRDIEALAEEGGEAGQRALEFQRVFKEEFGPTFARGPGDAATEFRRAFNVSRFERTKTPPSETAKKFIRPASPERAESLNRVLDLSGRGDEGRQAARQFLMADLASSGALNPDGTINRVRLGKWREKWGEKTLDTAAPGLAGELDNVASRAATDEATAAKLRQELDAAKDAANLTEIEIKKGALGFALDADPATAVSRVMSSGDPQANMRKIVAEIGDDERARDGLKQAVREWLLDTQTNAENGLFDGRPVSLAKISNLFERNIDALAEVYSPEEMNKLRQVHKLLQNDRFVKDIKAVVGSDTKPLQESEEQMSKAVEAALKLQFGMLKGGGINRALKLVKEATFGDYKQVVRRALTQMMLDPELAAHLLTREIDARGPAWNKRLLTLLGVGESARASAEDDAER